MFPLLALDINLTKELIDEGNLREIIRQLQVARKEAGFEISDRITLYLTAKNSEIDTLIQDCKDKICKEVLANNFEKQTNPTFSLDAEVAQTIVSIQMTKSK